eukprot:symbB.v1.2.026829.t1/scaffold2715.1/size72513/1
MVLLCSFRYIRFGSMRDVLRWSLVTPFFSGMLLTSMHASMTLVVVFRCLSPILALPIEWLYLKTFQVNRSMLVAMLLMLLGTSLYASQLPRDNLPGIQWVFLNMLLATWIRLFQWQSVWKGCVAPHDCYTNAFLHWHLGGVVLLHVDDAVDE